MGQTSQVMRKPVRSVADVSLTPISAASPDKFPLVEEIFLAFFADCL